jgi:hypothetical protein
MKSAAPRDSGIKQGVAERIRLPAPAPANLIDPTTHFRAPRRIYQALTLIGKDCGRLAKRHK